MFVGHFGLGLAAKRIVPTVSLGTLFLAVQLADILWPLFLLLGLEHVRIAPGITAFTPLDFYDYPITHSLVAQAGWGLAFGVGYWLMRRDAWAALVLGAGVVSHWVLDVVVHRPDLPVLPRGPYLGLGLWNSVPWTFAIEGAVYAIGVTIYLRATTAKDRIGRDGLWSLVLLLGLIWIALPFGPTPPSDTAVAVSGLAMWVVVPWGYWIDRHRSGVRVEKGGGR